MKRPTRKEAYLYEVAIMSKTWGEPVHMLDQVDVPQDVFVVRQNHHVRLNASSAW